MSHFDFIFKYLNCQIIKFLFIPALFNLKLTMPFFSLSYDFIGIDKIEFTNKKAIKYFQ